MELSLVDSIIIRYNFNVNAFILVYLAPGRSLAVGGFPFWPSAAGNSAACSDEGEAANGRGRGSGYGAARRSRKRTTRPHLTGPSGSTEPSVADAAAGGFWFEWGAGAGVMNNHLLRRAPEHRPPAEGLVDYDVIGTEGMIIGRIFKIATSPAGTPWMWTLSYGDDRERTSTHGYEPTREAAMAAFAKSWRRE